MLFVIVATVHFQEQYYSVYSVYYSVCVLSCTADTSTSDIVRTNLCYPRTLFDLYILIKILGKCGFFILFFIYPSCCIIQIIQQFYKGVEAFLIHAAVCVNTLSPELRFFKCEVCLFVLFCTIIGFNQKDTIF